MQALLLLWASAAGAAVCEPEPPPQYKEPRFACPSGYEEHRVTDHGLDGFYETYVCQKGMTKFWHGPWRRVRTKGRDTERAHGTYVDDVIDGPVAHETIRAPKPQPEEEYDDERDYNQQPLKSPPPQVPERYSALTAAYKKGKLEGPVKFWAKDHKRTEARYENGVLDGPWCVMDNDGKLVLRGEYRAGVPVGRWHTWCTGQRHDATLAVLADYGDAEGVARELAAGGDAHAALCTVGKTYFAIDLAIGRAAKKPLRSTHAVGTTDFLGAPESANADYKKIYKMLRAKGAEPGDLGRPLLSAAFPPDQLMNAIDRGDAGAVKAALADGEDPNVSANYGTSPLIQATAAGNLALMKVLLDGGAKNGILVQGADGCSEGMAPLMIAARDGNVDATRLLLDRGADPLESYGWCGEETGPSTAAEAALEAGKLETWNLIVERSPECADPVGLHNLPGAKYLSYPAARARLLCAAQKKPKDWILGAATYWDADIMRFLLDHSGGKERDPSWLLMAARRGAADVVALLIDHGIDVNYRGHNGETALIDAIMKRSPATVTLVLSRGARTDLKAEVSCAAAAAGDPFHGVTYLDSDRNGCSPLELARAKKLEKITAILEKAGAK
jgi:ankyrin repeat protein